MKINFIFISPNINRVNNLLFFSQPDVAKKYMKFRSAKKCPAAPRRPQNLTYRSARQTVGSIFIPTPMERPGTAYCNSFVSLKNETNIDKISRHVICPSAMFATILYPLHFTRTIFDFLNHKQHPLNIDFYLQNGIGSKGFNFHSFQTNMVRFCQVGRVLFQV